MMDDMAHDADHALGKQPAIVRLSVARRDRRASLHGYAGRRTRSWRPGGPETCGITGCCIRSKSSRFVIHSFREGNTRTQFVFFSQLAEQAGYRIDTEAFKVGSSLRDEFVQARFHSQDTGSNTRLAAVLSKAIEPIQTTPATPPPLSPELQKIVDLNKRDDPTSATEIGRPTQRKAPEARGYQPPAEGLSTDHGYGR